MWPILSLCLIVLMLVLSLRFYFSHCLPPSGKSAKGWPTVSTALKPESRNWKRDSTTTTWHSPSSGHASTSKKKLTV